MKKRVLLPAFFLLFILSFSVISAETNSTTEQQKVNDAYSCLTDRVKDNCASLSTEEKVFSLLALNQCKAELLSDSSSNGDCWPSGNCNLKTTAQATLALDQKGSSTTSSKNWLLSQKRTPSDMSWFLQVETNEQANCQIGYSGLSYELKINEDKTLEGNTGPGLSITEDKYWLQIFPEFYDVNIEISCDQAFLTNKLFKKSGSSTVHVFPESSSASAGGLTEEKVESFCFAQNNVCNYEGSLWAALTLNTLDEDINSYLPYLITLAEDNQKFLPDAFLYAITSDSDSLTSLLSRQIGNKWWASSSQGRFYDTALALYAIQHNTLTEKESAKNWLLEVQDANGCWDSGNIRNTAFVLASVWPGNVKGGGGGGTVLPSCETSGKYCVPAGNCEGGALTGYECSGLSSVCCSTPVVETSCSDLSGDICSSNEVCERGTLRSASDTVGATCCVGDICKPNPNPVTSQCESFGGSCRVGNCLGNEESSSTSCNSPSESCCLVSTAKQGTSYTLLWILLILIAFSALGIIFKEKLRHFLLMIKSKLGKPKFNNPSGRFPSSVGSPGPSYYPPARRFPPRERRIFPPRAPPQPRPKEKPKSSASKELDDVLKKLREMSK